MSLQITSKQTINPDWSDREYVLNKMKQNGLMLRHCDSFLADKEIVLAATKQNEYAFSYADESLTTELEFCIQCFIENKNVIDFFTSEIQEFFNKFNNDVHSIKQFFIQQEANEILISKLSTIEKVIPNKLFKRKLLDV